MLYQPSGKRQAFLDMLDQPVLGLIVNEWRGCNGSSNDWRQGDEGRTNVLRSLRQGARASASAAIGIARKGEGSLARVPSEVTRCAKILITSEMR